MRYTIYHDASEESKRANGKFVPQGGVKNSNEVDKSGDKKSDIGA